MLYAAIHRVADSASNVSVDQSAHYYCTVYVVERHGDLHFPVWVYMLSYHHIPGTSPFILLIC